MRKHVSAGLMVGLLWAAACWSQGAVVGKFNASGLAEGPLQRLAAPDLAVAASVSAEETPDLGGAIRNLDLPDTPLESQVAALEPAVSELRLSRQLSLGSRETIGVVPIGKAHAREAAYVEQAVVRAFGARTVRLPRMELDGLRSSGVAGPTGDLNADRLLDALFDRVPEDVSRAIGVSDLALFGPVKAERKIVFRTVNGLASRVIGKPVAVVSTRYLEDMVRPWINQGRGGALLSLVVHEIGHTFGLEHCLDYTCALSRGAVYMEFCEKCAGLVRSASAEGRRER